MRRRADVVLAERGFFESRERAKAAILAGEVRVGDRVIAKAGEQIETDAPIQVAEAPRFVSRGGHKLAGALDVLGITVAGARAIDVGASTGGFTDCLLQRGVASVVAVDVGYGQLAWKLRNDERVDVHERLNIRHADVESLGAPFDLVVVDVSFISLRVVLPILERLAGEDGSLLMLVKPQFEAGKGRVGKKGVVRDQATHHDVVSAALESVRSAGLVARGLTWSPLKGPEGNIEFWLWASRSGEDVHPQSEQVVSDAHTELGE